MSTYACTEQPCRTEISRKRSKYKIRSASEKKQADLLFLPLAFDTHFPDLVRTSAPGKTGEYLAARRPILVHVPADAFLAWYFQQHECGLVVTESDPAKLAQAMETILTDPGLRRRLAENAWGRAKSHFSISASQKAFSQLMELTN